MTARTLCRAIVGRSVTSAPRPAWLPVRSSAPQPCIPWLVPSEQNGPTATFTPEAIHKNLNSGRSSAAC